MTEQHSLARLIKSHAWQATHLVRGMECACGAVGFPDHDDHLAATVLASDWLASHDTALIEQARAEGKAEALREAADDVAYEVRRFEVGCESDVGYYDAHMEIFKMLRDRAARLADGGDER